MAKNNATQSVKPDASNSTDNVNIADAKSTATEAANSTTTTPTNTPERPWYADTIESNWFSAMLPEKRKLTITQMVIDRLVNTNAYSTSNEAVRNEMVNQEVNSIMGIYGGLERQRERDAKLARQRAEYESQRQQLVESNKKRATDVGLDPSILDKPITPVETPELVDAKTRMQQLRDELARLEREAKYAEIAPLVKAYDTELATRTERHDKAKAIWEQEDADYKAFLLTDPRRLVETPKSTESTPRVRKVRNGESSGSGSGSRSDDKRYTTFKFSVPPEEVDLLVNKPHVVVGDLDSTTGTYTCTITVKGERSNNSYYARNKLNTWLTYKPVVDEVESIPYAEWTGDW